MALCVVIGNDPVGKHVAGLLRTVTPDAFIIGLEGARDWLDPLVRHVEYLTVLEFGRLLTLLNDNSVTEVVFAGGAIGSVRLWRVDKTAMRYIMLRRPTLWWPQAYLEGLTAMLSKNEIKLKSVVDVVPDLGLSTSLIANRHLGHDAARDMIAALQHIRGMPWRKLRQAHIVDQGRVRMSETDGTNNLLRRFGSSSLRKGCSFPVLCKVAVPPFENVIPATIGLETAQIANENGIDVIVVKAGKTIVMQKEKLGSMSVNGSISVLAI